MDEPLIYTKLGNLPIKDLEYKHWWHENDNEIFFHEEYWYKGELVKKGAHGYLKKGVSALFEQGSF